MPCIIITHTNIKAEQGQPLLKYRPKSALATCEIVALLDGEPHVFTRL